MIVLLALMLVIIAVVNILHSGIKTILRQRGYAVSLWYGHFRDISLSEMLSRTRMIHLQSSATGRFFMPTLPQSCCFF